MHHTAVVDDSGPALVTHRQAARADKAARWLSDVLAPAPLVVVTVLLVAVIEAGLWNGLWWSAITLVFVPGIPLAVLALGVRRRWWTDSHLRVRSQRFVPMGVALLSILAGLAVLAAAGAPADLSALVVSMTAGLGATLAVTFVWKISVHAAVAAGSAVVFAVQLGPAWGLVGAAATVAVGWSRCRLRDHTLAQVLVGAAVGAVVAATVFGRLAG